MNSIQSKLILVIIIIEITLRRLFPSVLSCRQLLSLTMLRLLPYRVVGKTEEVGQIGVSSAKGGGRIGSESHTLY